ncbi:hypothetical protein H0E87_030912 [Populus deltoides]|uniref:Uncharacterized protein n=1 Tax=Populus deltoides TaxID=3696 RepID=A0A8T2WJ89_POPDE|nr:hypothetical protein H0E87_030912 [Populus deltoides]
MGGYEFRGGTGSWGRRTSHDWVEGIQLSWVSCFNRDHNDAAGTENGAAAMTDQWFSVSRMRREGLSFWPWDGSGSGDGG